MVNHRPLDHVTISLEAMSLLRILLVGYLSSLLFDELRDDCNLALNVDHGWRMMAEINLRDAMMLHADGYCRGGG